MFAVAITGMWLVLIGVFVGGAVIPHHDDRPTLAPATDIPTATSKRPASAFRKRSRLCAYALSELDPSHACRFANATASPTSDGLNDRWT